MIQSTVALRQFSKQFASRLHDLQPLADREREALRVIEQKPVQSHAIDETLVAQGGVIRSMRLVVAGWAAQVRQLKDGRRQITGLLLPGDIIGLSTFAESLAPSSVVALTRLHTVGVPEVTGIWRDRERFPGIARALDVMAVTEQFFLHGQIMRLGRQNAHERTANFFMELEWRLSAIGLSTNGAFRYPLTQDVLADVLGLSPVHVNRTLQQMRRDKHIELNRGELTLMDRNVLGRDGQFKPPQLSIRVSEH